MSLPQTVSKSKPTLEENIDSYRLAVTNEKKHGDHKEWASLHRLLAKFVSAKTKSVLGINIAEALQHTVLGEQALHKGEREEAQSHFKDAIKCDPYFEDALVHLAFLEAHEKGLRYKTECARNAYRYLKKLDWRRNQHFWTDGKSLKHTPYRWKLLLNGLLLKGDVSYKLGKHKESLEAYEGAWEVVKCSLRSKRNSVDSVETNKMSKKCLSGIVRMQLHVRTATENIVWFRNILTAGKKPSFREFDRSLKQLVLSKYASLLLRHSSPKDYQDALKLIGTAQTRDKDEFVPKNPMEDCLLLLKLHLKLDGLSPGKIAKAENELCLAFARAKKWHEIAEMLRNSVAIDMGNIMLWYKLGLALMSAGEYPEALLALKQVGNTITELTKLNPARWGEMQQYKYTYLISLLLSTKICVNYISKTEAAVKFAKMCLDVVQNKGNWDENHEESGVAEKESSTSHDRHKSHGSAVQISSSKSQSKEDKRSKKSKKSRKFRRHKKSKDKQKDVQDDKLAERSSSSKSKSSVVGTIEEDQEIDPTLLQDDESRRDDVKEVKSGDESLPDNRKPRKRHEFTSKATLREVEAAIDHRVTCYYAHGVACAVHAYEVPSFSDRKRLQKTALVSLTKALKLSKYNQNIVFNLAAAHADIREIDLGIRMVHYSLSLDRSHVKSWHLMALLLTSQKKYENAIKAIEDAINIEPENLRLQLTKARIFADMGLWDHSVSTFNSLVKKAFDQGECNAVKYTIKSSTGRKSHDREAERPVFRHITYLSAYVHQHSSSVYSPVTMRGLPRTHQQDVIDEEEIKEDIEQLGFEFCSTDPTSPSDPYPSFQSLHSTHKGDDPNALKYEILLSLSALYIKRKEEMQDSAFQCGYRALDMARETKALSWLPHIHAQVGALFEEINDPETAVKHYENAIAFQSTHAKSLTRLGFIENDRGNYDMAHGYLTDSLRVDSTQHEAWCTLGLVRQHQEKHEDAAEAFLTSLELETTCPTEEFSAVKRYLGSE